jgi:hypothetical protein
LNNVNDVSIISIVDYQVLPLDPHIQAVQEAYIRKVVDTVHDLPNVLYEVVNESSGEDAESVRLPEGKSLPVRVGDSTKWQYWVIDFVKRYEQQMGYAKHPGWTAPDHDRRYTCEYGVPTVVPAFHRRPTGLMRREVQRFAPAGGKALCSSGVATSELG